MYARRLRSNPIVEAPPESQTMRVVGIILIMAGALSLVFGGFSYTQEKTVVKLGPLELNAKQTKSIDIPMWGGIAAIVVGGLMLVASGRKR